MNIKKAWLALWDMLEPETVEKIVEKEVPVIVGSSIENIYLAESNTIARLARIGWHTSYTARPDWHGKYFKSCTDAFAACGDDANVTSKRALVSGNKAFLLAEGGGVDLLPKPKVPKGKRKPDGRS